MKLQALALAAALSTGLAGCSTFQQPKTQVVAATPDSVTIRFNEGDLADATGRAEGLCKQQGRLAHLQRVTPGEAGDRIGVFSCV